MIQILEEYLFGDMTARYVTDQKKEKVGLILLPASVPAPADIEKKTGTGLPGSDKDCRRYLWRGLFTGQYPAQFPDGAAVKILEARAFAGGKKADNHYQFKR